MKPDRMRTLAGFRKPNGFRRLLENAFKIKRLPLFCEELKRKNPDIIRTFSMMNYARFPGLIPIDPTPIYQLQHHVQVIP